MNRSSLLFLSAAAAGLVLSSCTVTSISDTTRGGGRYGSNAFYGGELSELDVLGVPEGEVSESAIQAALGRAGSGSVRVPRGSRVMLVQSGAIHPDAALQAAMAQYYDVMPFSGAVEKRGYSEKSKRVPGSEAKRLRLAAAKAGVKHIVVVWGTLETAKDEMATGAVSWTPFVGRVVADEKSATRIVTTAAVIDTASGAWRSVSSDPVARRAMSSEISRDATWVRTVESLKGESYPNLAGKVAGL